MKSRLNHFLSIFGVLFSFLLFLSSSNSFSQTDRKTESYPELQNMLKGVWVTTPNGGPWIKVVINNNTYSWFSASPESGSWVDFSNHTKNRTFTSFLKVSERSRYDGKFFTYYIAYTDNDENGVYSAFRIDIKNGQQSLTVIKKGDKPNYSARTGNDLNAPIIVEGFKKKPANFDPWQ